MIELQVEPNKSTILHVQLGTTDTGLFPQVELFDIDDLDTVLETVNLVERSRGLYNLKWTAGSILTVLQGQTTIYTDTYGGTESPIDRPVPFTINVGRYSTGGVFFGSGGKKTLRTSLTQEEIKRIVKALMEKLNPILDKKSEFDPKTEIVMTDLEPINDTVRDCQYSDSELIKAIAELKTILDESQYDDSELVKLIGDSKYDDSPLIKMIKDSVYDDSNLIDLLQKQAEENLLLKDLILENKYDDKEVKDTIKYSEERNNVNLAIGFIRNNDYISANRIIRNMNDNEKKKLFDLVKGNKTIVKKLSQVNRLIEIIK